MAETPASPGGLHVSVDGRALDAPGLRAQGIGRYAHGLLGELPGVAAERDGRLTVLRRRGGEGSPFAAGPTGPAAGSSARQAPAGGAPATQRSLRRPPVPNRAAELIDQALLPLDLLRGGAAVHHALSLYGAPLAARTPLVVTMHDVVPLQWPSLYLRTGVVHRMLYRAVRRAAAVVCASRAARDDLLEHLDVKPERVTVVPEAAGEHFQPTDATAVRERLGLRGPYLLYVGGLAHGDPRKDVDGLITAFAAWARDCDRPETLVLAGQTGPATAELEGRARDLGARAVFPGFVPDDDLPALLSGASCLVSASRYEGFGLPALEAIACGTPVVGYDAGAVPESAGPGALLVEPGDGRALMRAAGRVCDEPELAERLSAAGREHAVRFSWRASAEATWRVYEHVAAGEAVAA